MKKLLALLIVLAMVACMFVGCGSGNADTTEAPAEEAATEEAPAEEAATEEAPAEEATEETAASDYSDYTIGFCGMTMNNEYHIVVANAAKAQAEESGVNIEIQAGAEHASVDEQIDILETFIAQEVDGIVLVPASSDGLYAPLKECKELGIPVIILDTDVSEQIRTDLDWDLPYYGTDNFEGAKLAGEWVAANYAEGTKTAILTGVEGQTNAVDRYEGFLEGVGAEYLNVVATQTANWETDQGYTAVQNILTANPDLELIFCCNDGMAYGALAAVKDANLQDQVDIIGYDGQSQALQYVISGEFVLDIAQHPAEMGRQGVLNLLAVFDGGEAENYINTGTGVIDATNAEEYYNDYIQYVE